MQARTYWNMVAGKKEFSLAVPLDALVSHLRSDSHILDFGCGYGRVLRRLSERGFENLHGIDIAEGMIALGKKDLPEVDLEVNSDTTISWPDSSLDCVILCAVLTCVVEDCLQEQLLKETTRVLRPEGILCLCDFLLNEDERNVERYEKYRHIHGTYGIFELDDGAVLRHHSREWIDSLTTPFQRLYFEEETVITMNGHKSRGVVFIGKNTPVSHAKKA